MHVLAVGDSLFFFFFCILLFVILLFFFFFFFNDTATTEIYTLSLHDALPIYLKNRYKKIEKHRNKQGLPPAVMIILIIHIYAFFVLRVCIVLLKFTVILWLSTINID